MPLNMYSRDENMMRPVIEIADRSPDRAWTEFARPMNPMVTGKTIRVYLTGLSCHISMQTAGMNSRTSVMYTHEFAMPTSTDW